MGTTDTRTCLDLVRILELHRLARAKYEYERDGTLSLPGICYRYFWYSEFTFEPQQRGVAQVPNRLHGLATS